MIVNIFNYDHLILFLMLLVVFSLLLMLCLLFYFAPPMCKKQHTWACMDRSGTFTWCAANILLMIAVNYLFLNEERPWSAVLKVTARGSLANLSASNKLKQTQLLLKNRPKPGFISSLPAFSLFIWSIYWRFVISTILVVQLLVQIWLNLNYGWTANWKCQRRNWEMMRCSWRHLLKVICNTL